jgi:aminoglycoside phosphotransferase (APT) family kinase protein
MDPFEVTYRVPRPPNPFLCRIGGPAHGIGGGINGMSAHPAEFKETAHMVPQDWVSLARYLGAHGIALGPGQPRQFAGGHGNLNYLIAIEDKPAVLRRPPAGRLPPGANDMAREYRILSSLWRGFPLAPRALFFCNDKNVLGAPFQIIEYRAGIVIRDTLPTGFSGSATVGALLSRQLVETLAALHSVDPAEVGLDTLGHPIGFLARTVEGWAVRAAAVLDVINPHALSEVVDWLRCRVPPDVPQA